jgi:hypothetical protein
VWQYRTKGTLWRIGPAGASSLVGEDRDQERKIATFFCLDRTSGQVRWEGKEFGDRWWVGMEGVVDEILLLHGYAHPDMPAHRGLIAVDIQTGEHLWSNKECVFSGATGGTVLGARFGFTETDLLELDSRTGEVRRLVRGQDEAALLLRQAGRTSERNEQTLPVPVPQLEDVTVQELITQAADIDFASGEGLVSSDFVIVSGISPAGGNGSRNHILAVIDRHSGEVVLRETLRSRAGRAVPDSFFVIQKMLYFICQRTTLIAVSLEQR